MNLGELRISFNCTLFCAYWYRVLLNCEALNTIDLLKSKSFICAAELCPGSGHVREKAKSPSNKFRCAMLAVLILAPFRKTCRYSGTSVLSLGNIVRNSYALSLYHSLHRVCVKHSMSTPGACVRANYDSDGTGRNERSERMCDRQDLSIDDWETAVLRGHSPRR